MSKNTKTPTIKMPENNTPVKKMKITLPADAPKGGSGKVSEEFNILSDLASGKTYAQCQDAFMERRKNSSKQSSPARFKVYFGCAIRKAQDLGFEI